jgi:hypothetical protein
MSLTRTLIVLYLAGSLVGRGWMALTAGHRNVEAVQIAARHVADELGGVAELGRWLNGDGDTIVRGTE